MSLGNLKPSIAPQDAFSTGLVAIRGKFGISRETRDLMEAQEWSRAKAREHTEVGLSDEFDNRIHWG